MHTTPPSLLQRLRLPGEDPAWERFVALYTPFIFRLARRAGHSRDGAADLVQEVFLLLAKKMPTFQYDVAGSFRAWLRTVVMNKIYELARRRAVPTVAPADGIDLLDEAQPDVALAFEEAEYGRHVVARAAMIMQRDFAPTTWRAFWEHTVSGRQASDVAAELGLSEGAVYVAKCRVLRKLRAELKGLM